MSLRKNSSTNTSDTSPQQAICYIREFSANACRYRCKKNEDVLLLVNRSATLLITVVEPSTFNPLLVEVSKFFIDLYAVMGNLAMDSDAMWSCINLLQHCARNLEARRAIILDYRFVPLLASLLKRTQTPDKMKRLLNLLQELTFGIQLLREEPYLLVMIGQLVSIVSSVDDDQTNAKLALSIIINLCYKNFVGKFLFLRTVHISSFSRKIKNFGMLSQKLFVILSDDVHTSNSNSKELQLFLQSNMTDIAECISEWNVPFMRHIIDFLMDSKAYENLHNSMLEYGRYCEDMERILNQVDKVSVAGDVSEDTKRHQQICLGLIFRLINYILKLGTLPRKNGAENIISLDSNMSRIFELLCKWINSDICGIDAIDLVVGIIKMAKESKTTRLIKDASFLNELINILKKPETTAEHKASILRLLETLLVHCKFEKVVLSKINVQLLNDILDPLNSNACELSEKSVTNDEIEKYVCCLLLVVNCARIDPISYEMMCKELLQRDSVQYILSRAMVSSKKTVCLTAYQILRFEHFPLEQLAEQAASNRETDSSYHIQSNVSPHTQWDDLSSVLKFHRTFISKEVEERLNALVTAISDAHTKLELNNVATSQIIELYNYKIENFVASECYMQQRLQHDSEEITHLSQRISLQNAELQKYHTINLDMHVNMENLQTRCNDLNQQKNNIKANMAEHLKMLSEQKKALQIFEKQMAMKCAVVADLERELQSLKDLLHTKGQELEKSHATTRENLQRIEKLKKSIGVCEISIKDKQRIIDDKDRELVTTNKLLDEQRDLKKKAEDVIVVLEAQLKEKIDKIHGLENQLTELEEVRQAVMSLMGRKKAKHSEK